MVTEKRREQSAARECATGNADKVRSATRIPRKVFFVSNFSLDTSARDVVDYCQKRKITVTGCVMFPSKIFYGTLCAKLTAESSGEEEILSDEFWPNGISVRPWRFPESNTDQPQPNSESK